MEGAINACCFQAMLGHPSRKNFKNMVDANLIASCPVTPENISQAHHHFGKNFAGLRKKAAQKSQNVW